MSSSLPSKGYLYAFTPEAREDYIARDKAKPISTGTSVRYKQADRDRIAADIAAFENRGGCIQVLDNDLGPKRERRHLRDMVRDAFEQKKARHAAANRLAEEEE